MVLKCLFFHQQLLIVFTDGKQTRDEFQYTPLGEASEPLRQKKVDIFAVGVGDAAFSELRQLTESNEHVFIAKSFADLGPLASEVLAAACSKFFFH